MSAFAAFSSRLFEWLRCSSGAALLLAVLATPVYAGTDVPVPRPKPELDTVGDNTPVASPPDGEVAAPPPPPKQTVPAFDLAAAGKCEQELKSLGAKFSIAEPLQGDGICGWQRPLNLTATGNGVGVTGDPSVRCEVALALTRWSLQVVGPTARLHLDSDLSKILISTSYQCRRRNNAATGKISEHGFANGVDVLGFELEDGRQVLIKPRLDSSKPERAFQAAVRAGSCAYFTTVLGPTTGASHDNHLHLDLAIRRGGYRLCQ